MYCSSTYIWSLFIIEASKWDFITDLFELVAFCMRKKAYNWITARALIQQFLSTWILISSVTSASHIPLKSYEEVCIVAVRGITASVSLNYTQYYDFSSLQCASLVRPHGLLKAWPPSRIHLLETEKKEEIKIKAKHKIYLAPAFQHDLAFLFSFFFFLLDPVGQTHFWCSFIVFYCCTF